MQQKTDTVYIKSSRIHLEHFLKCVKKGKSFQSDSLATDILRNQAEWTYKLL